MTATSSKWHEPTTDELIEQGNKLFDDCMKLSLEIVELRKSNEMSAAQSKAFGDSVEWNRMIDAEHYLNMDAS